MAPLPPDSGVILAACCVINGNTSDAVVLLWLAIVSTWLTAALLSYGSLLLAMKTRLARRAPAKRARSLHKMLRFSFKQAQLSLWCVPLYFVFVILRFFAHESYSHPAVVVEFSRDFAQLATKGIPIAALALIPLGVSWAWLDRMRRLPIS